MSHDERDQVVDFVHRLAEKTEVPIVNFVAWLGSRQVLRV